MATASQFTPSRNEQGEEIHPMNAGVTIPGKSYMVGRFDEFGRKITNGEFIGGDSIAAKHKRQLLDSMRNHGRLMPGFVMTDRGPMKVQPAPVVKGKKSKAAKVVKTKQAEVIEEVQEDQGPVLYPDAAPVNDPVYKPKAGGFNVTFSIDSGKIRSKADAVLENEHALMLVYADEDAISYLPEKGGELVIVTPDKREVPVLYLGLQFEWYTSRQQILVFMKTDVNED